MKKKHNYSVTARGSQRPRTIFMYISRWLSEGMKCSLDTIAEISRKNKQLFSIKMRPEV